MNISIRVDDRALQEIARSFGPRARRAITRGFAQSGEILNRRMGERFRANDATVSAKTFGDKARDFLFRRTGSGQRSFNYVVVEDESGVPVVLSHFTNWKPARLQEKGGEVKPKRAKYLTVPLPNYLSGGGDARFGTAQELFDRMNLDRDGSRTWIGSGSKPGNKKDVIYYVAPESDKVLALFKLKKSVTIPPRLGYERTFREALPDMRERVAATLVEEFAS